MTKAQSLWNHGVKIGAIGGVSVLIIALVGMIESFGKRDIISGILPMGIAMALIICTLVAYIAADKTPISEKSIKFVNAVISGFVTSGFLALLVVIGRSFNMRDMLIAASPALYKALTAGIAGAGGIFLILAVGLICGIFAGVLILLYTFPRKLIIKALATIFILGLLQELIMPLIKSWNFGITNYLGKLFYTQNGLTIIGVVLAAVIFCIISLLWKANQNAIKGTYTEYWLFF